MNQNAIHPRIGLLLFLISLVTYVLCLEPSVSWWDCGEFIASSYRLEVGHPPGAPLFLLLGRFFSLFAKGPQQVALMLNLLSALASALTIFFLYHTIVMLAQKLQPAIGHSRRTLSWSSILAGVVGSLVYAFSDSFWFSAVEAEVYAMSSLFTALVFWAILRWEREADEPGNLRWILLIAFLMGLSIGVHLLNLLAIPAITLVWYYRKYPQHTWKGALTAFAGSLGILAFIMYGLIPGVPVLASWFELFFVNLFHLPYNSGLIIFVLLVIGGLTWGIRETRRMHSVTWNTVLLGFTLLLTGYSSYTTLLIRSGANPPMDQNNPDNVFSLIGYLNREQYGDRPLLTGPVFNAPLTGQKPGKAVYGRVNGRYEIVDRIYKPVYDKRFLTLFPRMWHNSPDHVRLYKEWSAFKGRPVEVQSGDGKPQVELRPTFTENLRFFFSYQVGHMYFRYFMWNFAGRQNDTEGQGGIRNGNWISGINFIDEARLGPQNTLPDRDKNSKSRNKYFLLPLFLGLTGAIYQYRRSPRDFRVVLLLFFFTGIAIVMYLNQYPNQPRERDYSYAGSFYAFAIWVGMGAAALSEVIRGRAVSTFTVNRGPAIARRTEKGAAVIVSFLLLAVPFLMAVQNCDDHDRSGRYIARDFAYNYLNSCAPDAILFTSGDNDTFPLWYAQEVEGIRTDVRVICLPYLASDWYIDQLKRKSWLSDPVPFSLTPEQYGPGKRDYIPVIEQVADTVDLDRIIRFVGSDDESVKVALKGGGSINYFPSRKLRLAVDRRKVVSNGTVPPEDAALIVPEITWELNRTSLYKNDLMILDLLAHNNWDRPVYFTSLGHENILGLRSFFRQEGFAYRLVPIRQPDNGVTGSINTGILYDRLMNTFRWGNMNDPSVLIDSNTYLTTLIIGIRQRFADLADALLTEGKVDSALAVVNRVWELLPSINFPDDVVTAGLAEICYKAGSVDRGNRLLDVYVTDIEQNIKYLRSVESRFGSIMSEQADSYIFLLDEIRKLADTYNQSGVVMKIDKILDQSGIRQK